MKASLPDPDRLNLSEQIETIKQNANRHPDEVLEQALQALSLAKKNQMNKEKAELLRLIGLIWYYKVDYAQALSYFSQSMEHYRALTDTSGLAAALNNISIVYRQQGFINKALEMDQQVLNMRKSTGDKEMIAASYNNLGVAYLDLQDYDAALYHFNEAIATALHINDKQALDLYYNNKGNLYLTIGIPDSAFHYFTASLAISTENNHLQMMANSYIYLGQYYQQKKDLSRALHHFEKGLSLARKIGIIYEIEWAAQFLHEAYAMAENYQKAYEMHVLFKTMADSAKNMETIQKITQIESALQYKQERELEMIKQSHTDLAAQLELNKQKQFRNLALLAVLILLIITLFSIHNYRLKQKDNIALEKQKAFISAQNEEIKMQNKRIDEMNADKDKFFAIIAHDLRNPLGGIQNLSEVLYRNYEELDTDKQKKYLFNIKSSAKSVYILLDNLLHWSSLQMGSLNVNPISFDLNIVVLQNIDLLLGIAIQKKIVMHYDELSNCQAFADKDMINTVVRNLLTNAVKFTPEGGKVNIVIKREDKFWHCSISDNGIGIPDEEQENLFILHPQTPGKARSKDKGIGLGLLLCKEFTLINGGNIWVKSKTGKGSTFSFTVPVAYESANNS